jgi:hypothetical protein
MHSPRVTLGVDISERGSLTGQVREVALGHFLDWSLQPIQGELVEDRVFEWNGSG